VRLYKLLYVIGDSISLGYCRYLIERLHEAYVVLHAPGGSASSTNIVNNLEDWLAGYDPDVVLFNCGLHDIMTPADRSVTLPDQYETNLRGILNNLTELSCSPRIVWCSTTPVIDKRHQAVNPFARHNEDVIAYNQIADQVMTAADVETIDLYEVVVNNGPDALLTTDGAHFTEQGYQILAEAIANYLTAGS